MSTVPTNDEELRAEVRHRYAQAALEILETEQPPASACCGPSCCTPSLTVASTASSCCGTGDGSSVTADLYSQAELGTIPVAAALASLGCGNPTALAELKSGEKVPDL